MEISEGLPEARMTRLRALDVVPLWLGLGVWASTLLLRTRTDTLTSVAILCLLVGLLGILGTRGCRGSDAERPSALLRGLVYLFVMAGLLLLDDHPMAPTQQLYVRLAGLMALLAFVVTYRPALFAKLIRRVGAIVEGREMNH